MDSRYQELVKTFATKPNEFGQVLEAAEKRGELKEQDIDKVAELLKQEKNYAQWVPAIKVGAWHGKTRYMGYETQTLKTTVPQYRAQQLLLMVFARSQSAATVTKYVKDGLLVPYRPSDSSFYWGLPLLAYECIRAGHNDLVKFIIELGHPYCQLYFFPEDMYAFADGNTVLHAAVRQKSLDPELLVELFSICKRRNTPNTAGQTMFDILVQRNADKEIDYLMSHVPASITYFPYKVVVNHMDVVKKAILHADVETVFSLLTAALQNNDVDFSKWLLRHVANIPGHPSMMHAAVSQTEIDDELLQRLCGLDYQTSERHSPGMEKPKLYPMALLQGDESKKTTPLDTLLAKKAFETVAFLLKTCPQSFSSEQLYQLWFHEDFKETYRFRQSISVVASKCDAKVLNKFLCRFIETFNDEISSMELGFMNNIMTHRPDVIRMNTPGTTTPLHCAYQGKVFNLDRISQLYDAGASLTVEDEHKQTPLDVLLKRPKPEVQLQLEILINKYPERFSLAQLQQIESQVGDSCVSKVQAEIAARTELQDKQTQRADEVKRFKAAIDEKARDQSHRQDTQRMFVHPRPPAIETKQTKIVTPESNSNSSPVFV